MTVAELIERLSVFEDDTEVYVQGPDDQIWPMADWVGDDGDEQVFVIAAQRTPHAKPDGGSDA